VTHGTDHSSYLRIQDLFKLQIPLTEDAPDERLAIWRHPQMATAGRQIARRPGTGGSEGMAYLDRTLAQRLYPILWQVRSVP
jgi:tryptophan 2,3-dioxygenase